MFQHFLRRFAQTDLFEASHSVGTWVVFVALPCAIVVHAPACRAIAALFAGLRTYTWLHAQAIYRTHKLIFARGFFTAKAGAKALVSAQSRETVVCSLAGITHGQKRTNALVAIISCRTQYLVRARPGAQPIFSTNSGPAIGRRFTIEAHWHQHTLRFVRMAIVGIRTRGALPTKASAISIFSAKTAVAVVCYFTWIPYREEAAEAVLTRVTLRAVQPCIRARTRAYAQIARSIRTIFIAFASISYRNRLAHIRVSHAGKTGGAWGCF